MLPQSMIEQGCGEYLSSEYTGSAFVVTKNSGKADMRAESLCFRQWSDSISTTTSHFTEGFGLTETYTIAHLGRLFLRSCISNSKAVRIALYAVQPSNSSALRLHIAVALPVITQAPPTQTEGIIDPRLHSELYLESESALLGPTA